jgi:hypothetical protein
MGIQPNGFLKEMNAFRQSLLLKPNGAKNRARCCAGIRIGEGKLGLLICLFQSAFLN